MMITRWALSLVKPRGFKVDWKGEAVAFKQIFFSI